MEMIRIITPSTLYSILELSVSKGQSILILKLSITFKEISERWNPYYGFLD